MGQPVTESDSEQQLIDTTRPHCSTAAIADNTAVVTEPETDARPQPGDWAAGLPARDPTRISIFDPTETLFHLAEALEYAANDHYVRASRWDTVATWAKLLLALTASLSTVYLVK